MGKFTEETRGMKIDRKIRSILCVLAILMVFLGCAFKNATKDYTINNDETKSEISSYQEVILSDDAVATGSVSDLLSDNEDSIDGNSIIESISSTEYLVYASEEIDIENEISKNIKQPIKLVDYNKCFTGNIDIGAGFSGVTAEMLDEATDYYQKYQNFDNPFKNNGWIFIEAQEKSGLDALFIYSLAVFESGWGTSKIAKERSNYFGIGAWDIDMERSKYMGNDLYSGIVNGAIWISEHYYTQGQTTMTLMNSVPEHSYAPGNEVWVPKVVNFINNFYENWREF